MITSIRPFTLGNTKELDKERTKDYWLCIYKNSYIHQLRNILLKNSSKFNYKSDAVKEAQDAACRELISKKLNY